MTHIRLTIERLDDDGNRRVIHNDFQPVDKKKTVERTIQYMAQLVQEKFLDKPPKRQRD